MQLLKFKVKCLHDLDVKNKEEAFRGCNQISEEAGGQKHFSDLQEELVTVFTVRLTEGLHTRTPRQPLTQNHKKSRLDKHGTEFGEFWSVLDFGPME